MVDDTAPLVVLLLCSDAGSGLSVAIAGSSFSTGLLRVDTAEASSFRLSSDSCERIDCIPEVLMAIDGGAPVPSPSTPPALPEGLGFPLLDASSEESGWC